MHDDDDFPEHFHILPGETVEDVEGLETLSLTSVGIDIGSSTSHLVFSHLKLGELLKYLFERQDNL